MEEQSYTKEVQLFNNSTNPKASYELQQILSKQFAQQASLLIFLAQLKQAPTQLIKYTLWLQRVRLLCRKNRKIKSAAIQQAIVEYILKSCIQFFPYHITPQNQDKFDKIVSLTKGMKVRVPQNLTNQKEIILYIQNQCNQQFEAALLQTINSQILIDKKNITLKSLKINKYFAPFVAKNFDKILPQLQRLLVRSSNNIQVWCDFFKNLNPVVQFDDHISLVFKSLKPHLLTFSDYTVPIINLVTSNITKHQTMKQTINTLGSLISGEHQAKKKLLYVQMLDGGINSLKNFKDNTEYVNEIFRIFCNSWIKFVFEQDFHIIAQLLDKILQQCKTPTNQIGQALKAYTKSNNKLVLVCFANTLARLFRKEHYENFPAVKEIYNYFKSQVKKLMTKMDTTWQWIIPVIIFMSFVDNTNLDLLGEQLPFFKNTILTMQKLEKKNLANLYLQIIKKSTEDQDQVPEYILYCFTFLLENTRDKQLWETIPKIPANILLKMIGLCIYSSLWFQSPQVKNSKFLYCSLVRKIMSSMKFKVPLQNQRAIQIITVSKLTNVKVKGQGQLSLQKADFALKKSLYNMDKSDKYLPNLTHKNICALQGVIALEFVQSPFFIQTLEFLLNCDNYNKNLQPLIEYKQKLKESIEKQVQILEDSQNILNEKGFFHQVKPIERKIYAFDEKIKMMSEEEVKQQKYKLHFIQMNYYLQKFIKIVLNVQNRFPLLQSIWLKHYKSIFEISKFPQNYLCLYSFSRQTCVSINIAHLLKMQKQNSVLVKKFYDYSSFVADFFISKGTHHTPPLNLMQKCENFLKTVLSNNLTKSCCQLMLLFLNEICQFLLENMQFDIDLKKLAVKFYKKMIDQNLDKWWEPNFIYTFLVKSLNILSSCEETPQLLRYCCSKVPPNRYSQLFDEILSYVDSTKKLILRVMHQRTEYKPQFQDYIKLRILSLETEGDGQIGKLSEEIIKIDTSHLDSITKFNMKNFIHKNSKETIEKLCQFMKQSMKQQLKKPIFQMVLKTARDLYDEHFDEEGLQFFPYFLSLNIDSISQEFYQPIFNLLVMQFTSNPDHQHLSRISLDIGIQIIKNYAPIHSNQLLKVLESFINRVKGISNIIFLGVLAPFLKNNNSQSFLMVQKRITQLFKGDHQSQQKSISKCMPDLMSFFKQPAQKCQNIYDTICKLDSKVQTGQAYLLVGLLKGIGPSQAMEYLKKIIDDEYPTKKPNERTARLWILNAYIENFGRVVELQALKIINIIINLNADGNEDIRQIAKKVGKTMILRMSSFSVKQLLPHLLKRLDGQQNWRLKISYIWILGIMANSSAKQLQTSLPEIVPTLSACLSNAHPTIRQKAAEALSLIGQTIKNIQISQSIDILIDALENPFEKSQKALQVLLKTRFSHYIDPPSLSIIIPIIDYCLRGRSSQLKAGACQVMGSVCQLIQNQYDLLPYLKFITVGLKVVLCDPLTQIRSIAAMAIGKIASKIGSKQAEQHFKFVENIINNPLSNTTEKNGAAQGYSEIICSQDFDYFQQSLNKIFDKLSEAKHAQKQGLILIFLYVPGIRKDEFEGFIKQVNQNMYGFVSDEDQNIRNSAMQVQKVLINNYSLTHTDLLLDPLCQGIFEENWRKRNAALILIGEMLNIIKSYAYNTKSQDKNYAYYQGLMAVYIMKDDELQMPRNTANLVWNTYIENTPKTIRSGLKYLVRMWARFTNAAGGIVYKNIIGFSSKYGQNYFTEILQYLEEFLEDQIYRKGVFDVLAQFVKRLTQQFLSKESYKAAIRSLYERHLFQAKDEVKTSLARSISLYIEKMKQQSMLFDVLFPQIDRMSQLSQNDESYIYNLHLIRDFLRTSSRGVVEMVIKKVMSIPLTQFKIDIITNNADRVANSMYTLFQKPATHIMLQQALSLQNANQKQQNRARLIVYCLNQVSTYLQPKFKLDYMSLLTKNIQEISRKNEKQNNENMLKVQLLLEMLQHFLQASSLQQIQDLEILIGNISPLINYNGKIMELTHKIFLILISDPKSSKTNLYYKQLLVSLENNSKRDLVWKDLDIIQNYISTVVKGVAYGTPKVMEQCIKMIDFMLKQTDPEIMKTQLLRLLGPIIRVTNYPLPPSQKLMLLDFLDKIQNSGFSIQCYQHQILSVCFRVLTQLRNNTQAPQIAANTFISLLNNSPHKQNIITTIISKSRNLNQSMIMSIYILVKILITKKTDLLPKSLLDYIYTEFKEMLQSPDQKPPIKTLFYISKTTARLSVYLKNDNEISTLLEGVTCSYETILYYLHLTYYSKASLPKLSRFELFMKSSSKQKVYYLLKSLQLCWKVNSATQSQYTLDYIKSLVPENLSGFDEIVDALQSFQ